MASVAVATELLAHPQRARWAYELADTLHIDRSSVNTILQRMADEGWLHDWWETDETVVGRPRRHYYTVNLPDGRTGLSNLVRGSGSGAELDSNTSNVSNAPNDEGEISDCNAAQYSAALAV